MAVRRRRASAPAPPARGAGAPAPRRGRRRLRALRGRGRRVPLEGRALAPVGIRPAERAAGRRPARAPGALLRAGRSARRARRRAGRPARAHRARCPLRGRDRSRARVRVGRRRGAPPLVVHGPPGADPAARRQLRRDLGRRPSAGAGGDLAREPRGGGAGDVRVIAVRTLTDGGQTSPQIAQSIADYLGAAERTLDIALYDVRLHDPSAQIVRSAFDAAQARGVAVRLAHNVDHGRKIPVPPPPRTEPSLLETLGVPTCPIPGIPDLMHHKFLIRDGASAWCGSTNWTEDSSKPDENGIVTVAPPGVAANYATDVEQLWSTHEAEKSGKVPSDPIDIGGIPVRTWFSPKRGERLAHRIANRIGM